VIDRLVGGGGWWLVVVVVVQHQTEKGYGSLRGRVQTFRLFDAARTESPDMKAFDRFLLQVITTPTHTPGPFGSSQREE
jgi:hypothetical protein